MQILTTRLNRPKEDQLWVPRPRLISALDNALIRRVTLISVPAGYGETTLVAEWLGESGFIACFVGGLLFGGLEKRHKHRLLLAAEGTGDTLALITWVVFGAVVVGQSIGAFSWKVVLYALLSLTVVRVLPVFLVLGGLQLRTDQKLFVGWFGPRGLASIVFAVIVMKAHLPGDTTLSMTVVCTILLSIIGHGLSATPLVAALAKRSGGSENHSTTQTD